MEQSFAFDQAAVMQALAMADAAAGADALVDNGLTALVERPSREPLAWVDELSQVWPHEAGSQMHSHITYLYTPDEVKAALQASHGIIVVNTLPSSVVDMVTGARPGPAQPDASPKAAAAAARGRMAMMQTFLNPAGAAVRSE